MDTSSMSLWRGKASGSSPRISAALILRLQTRPPYSLLLTTLQQFPPNVPARSDRSVMEASEVMLMSSVPPAQSFLSLTATFPHQSISPRCLSELIQRASLSNSLLNWRSDTPSWLLGFCFVFVLPLLYVSFPIPSIISLSDLSDLGDSAMCQRCFACREINFNLCLRYRFRGWGRSP